jgi:hypothetical protein
MRRSKVRSEINKGQTQVRARIRSRSGSGFQLLNLLFAEWCTEKSLEKCWRQSSSSPSCYQPDAKGKITLILWYMLALDEDRETFASSCCTPTINKLTKIISGFTPDAAHHAVHHQFIIIPTFMHQRFSICWCRLPSSLKIQSFSQQIIGWTWWRKFRVL